VIVKLVVLSKEIINLKCFHEKQVALTMKYENK